MSIVALVAMAGPAITAFVLLLSFVTAEAAGFHPYAVAPPLNVAQAAAIGDAARMLMFIARGDDPNVRWMIPRDLLDARGPMRITPVQAAILARRPEVVRLLLRRGGRADQPRRLACLSETVGQRTELPPAVFGAADRRYSGGPPRGGREALRQCGIPFE